VRVQASNRADAPSDFSAYSVNEIPAGVPDTPAKPTTTRLDPVGDQAKLRVTWKAPASNGDEIAQYTVTSHGGASAVVLNVAGGVTSVDIDVNVSTTGYTFSVVAKNKAGLSGSSPESDAIRGYVAPGAPTSVVAKPADNQVTVTWGAAPGNGSTDSEITYRYAVNGGSWDNDWVSGGTGTSGTIGNGKVNNNGSYTITVRAVTSQGNTPGPGAEAKDPVLPFGPVGQPSADASNGNDRVNFSWSVPGRNGRDFVTEVWIDGVPVNAATGSDSRVGWGTRHTIKIQVTDTETSTKFYEDEATSNAAPPTQWDRKVDAANTCAQDQLTTSRFDGTSCNLPGYWVAAGTTVTVKCYTDGLNVVAGTLQNNRWYKMTNNFYVSQLTLISGQDAKGTEPAGMPGC
jgi:hypothetical protein